MYSNIHVCKSIALVTFLYTVPLYPNILISVWTLMLMIPSQNMKQHVKRNDGCHDLKIKYCKLNLLMWVINSNSTAIAANKIQCHTYCCSFILQKEWMIQRIWILYDIVPCTFMNPTKCTEWIPSKKQLLNSKEIKYHQCLQAFLNLIQMYMYFFVYNCYACMFLSSKFDKKHPTKRKLMLCLQCRVSI